MVGSRRLCYRQAGVGRMGSFIHLQWAGVHSGEMYMEDYFFQAWINARFPSMNK